jgi:DNA-binding PadR family transcriptional regulator
LSRALSAAESAQYALLGLLLTGPAHGYDLARRFAPDSALGDMVHISSSHLYALLARLERDGLISGERQESGVRPPRHVFRLTDAGREAVLHWIDEPVLHPRDMRIDFPLKFYIARNLDSARASALVNCQRAAFVEYIRRLQNELAPSGPADDAAFIRLMRAGRIGRAQAALDWLDQCEALLPVLS